MEKKKKKKASKDQKKTLLTKDHIETMIRAKVEERGQELSPEEKERQVEAFKDIFVEGKTIVEAMDLPEEFPRILYNMAYDQYNLGLYRDAAQIFTLLTFFEPMGAKHQLGLAACNHRMEKFDEAIPHYFAAYFLDPSSPVPMVHASDCFSHIEEPTLAYVMLQKAVATSGNNSMYEHLKVRCYQMMKQLREQHGIFPEDNAQEPGDGEVKDPFSELRANAEKKNKNAA